MPDQIKTDGQCHRKPTHADPDNSETAQVNRDKRNQAPRIQCSGGPPWLSIQIAAIVEQPENKGLPAGGDFGEVAVSFRHNPWHSNFLFAHREISPPRSCPRPQRCPTSPASRNGRIVSSRYSDQPHAPQNAPDCLD